MNIRAATHQDRADIQAVHESAFPEGESAAVAKLATDLLAEETTPQIVSLVAEAEGSVIGHVAFSPVAIDDHSSVQGYILAPLGVKADRQKGGIGSRLIEHGMQQMSAMGVNVVFVYGDPQYYGRFGFSADVAERYTPPYPLEYPFGWQAIVLKESGVTESPIAISCVTSLSDPGLW